MIEQMQRQLLVDRVVTLFAPLDAVEAERVVGQLVYLEALDCSRELTLSIRSAGGSVAAALQILQTMAQLAPPVRTVCLDRCGGAATLLLAAGAPGLRQARRGAVISLDPLAAELASLHLHDKLLALLSAFTGRLAARLAEDLAMGLELTADGARAFGLIDEVVDGQPPP